MTVSKLYRVSCYLISKISHLFDYIRTWCKFYCLCDSFGRFQTSGVPYVNVSWKKGGSIVIGQNLRMNNGRKGNVIGYSEPCIFQAAGGSIVIGNNVGLSQSTLVAVSSTKISVGDYSLLGSGVKVYTSNFHSLDNVKRREPDSEESDVKNKDVIIGKDCFIGAGSLILKGVTIGDRSVIGAGSVVTKSIPADCIAAGNPCIVVKKNN